MIESKCSWGTYTREPQTQDPKEYGLTFELWRNF